MPIKIWIITDPSEGSQNSVPSSEGIVLIQIRTWINTDPGEELKTVIWPLRKALIQIRIWITTDPSEGPKLIISTFRGVRTNSDSNPNCLRHPKQSFAPSEGYVLVQIRIRISTDAHEESKIDISTVRALCISSDSNLN